MNIKHREKNTQSLNFAMEKFIFHHFSQLNYPTVGWRKNHTGILRDPALRISEKKEIETAEDPDNRRYIIKEGMPVENGNDQENQEDNPAAKNNTVTIFSDRYYLKSLLHFRNISCSLW